MAHGPGVTGPALGTRVFGIAGGGGQAELLAVPAVQSAPVPDSLDLVTAGGVPEVFVTAHDAMVSQAAIQSGETLLSARGRWASDRPRSSSARPGLHRGRHRPHPGEAGTVRGPRARPPRCSRRVSSIRRRSPTHHAPPAGPVNVTLELVGGDYLVTDLRVAGPRGRVVLIGMMAGSRAQPISARSCTSASRCSAPCSTVRSTDEKAAATDAFTRDVVPLLARRGRAGRRPHVAARRRPEAYDLLAAAAVFGTIVLDLT